MAIINKTFQNLDGYNGNGNVKMQSYFRGHTANPVAPDMVSVDIHRPAEMDGSSNNDIQQNMQGLSGWHGAVFTAISGLPIGAPNDKRVGVEINQGTQINNLGGQNTSSISGKYEVNRDLATLTVINDNIDVNGYVVNGSGVKQGQVNTHFSIKEEILGSGDLSVSKKSFVFRNGTSTVATIGINDDQLIQSTGVNPDP